MHHICHTKYLNQLNNNVNKLMNHKCFMLLLILVKNYYLQHQDKAQPRNSKHIYLISICSGPIVDETYNKLKTDNK